MPDISSVGHGSVGPLDRASSPTNLRRDPAEASIEPKAPPARPGDRVELSSYARYLDQLRQLPPGRLDRVDDVKRDIEAGRYETSEKLEAAIDRLLDEFLTD